MNYIFLKKVNMKLLLPLTKRTQPTTNTNSTRYWMQKSKLAEVLQTLLQWAPTPALR